MTTAGFTIHPILPDAPLHRSDNLTDDEKARASTFRFPEDRRRWENCRIVLREILAEACEISPADIRISTQPGGKPVLPPPFESIHFNLSHCPDLALATVGTSPVGIDVEPLHRGYDLLECESAFCHPLEIDRLPPDPPERAVRLLEIWTAKEAILKAHGSGLMQPPEEVALDFESGTARCEWCLMSLAGLRFHRLRHPLLDRHCAFIAHSGGSVRWTTPRHCVKTLLP